MSILVIYEDEPRMTRTHGDKYVLFVIFVVHNLSHKVREGHEEP